MYKELHEVLCARLCAAQIKYCIISPQVVRWQLLTGFEAVKKVHNEFIVAGISGNEENVKKYISEKTSTLNTKDIRRSGNTAEVFMNILNKIKGFPFTIQNNKSSLFDIHHVIKRWKVNEMSFCDELLEKCPEIATATETAIGKIHVLTGNLKKRFTTASAGADEEKQIKKRKRENATKSAKDKQKRLVASAISLLRTIKGSDKTAQEFKSLSYKSFTYITREVLKQ